MPITDDDYEPFTEDELYEQLADDLQALTEGEVEDAESSAIQSLLRAHARLLARNQEQSLDRLYDAGYIETATGEQLDMKVREVGIERNEATPATGLATFLREEEPTTDYIIQSGTPVATANGEVRFATTESGRLQFISGFENASLDSAWDGDTASFTPSSTQADRGSQSVEVAATSSVAIYRNDQTVAQGDRIRASVYLPANGGVGIRFGVVDNSQYHAVSVDSGAGTLSLIRSDGTETSLDSTGIQVPNGVWLTVEIDTETTGEVDARLLDASGEALASVADTDVSFQGTGVGIDSRDASTVKYVDDLCTTATTVNIEAQTGGAETNVGPDSLTVLPSPPTGVSAVTNPLPTGDVIYDDTNGQRFQTGTDRETDAELRDRALVSSSRGGAATADAVRSALRDIDEVIDAQAIENETFSTDAAGRPPLSIEFIVYGGSEAEIGNTLHDKVGLTERLVGGFVGTAVSYTVTDDLLSDDETYTWSEPNIDDIDLTLDIVVDETYAGDEAVKSALVEYIGGTDVDGSVVTGTGIGEDVRVDAIRDRVVGRDLGVRGVASVTIDANGDGTDDTTTDTNGLRVYDVPSSDVAQTDAIDGSITLTTTQE